MSTQSAVTAVRLDKSQLEALKNLPPPVTKSALVRTLLREYLAGKLPQIHALVLQEAAETAEAIREGHRVLKHWQEQQQQRQQNSAGDSKNGKN